MLQFKVQQLMKSHTEYTMCHA